MFFLTNNKAECTGCTACEKSCPVKAIHFKKDEEGFNYPLIDKTVCINCGLCESVCPVANPKYENAENPEVYAAILKDESQRVKSTSGGVFYAIAMWIIQRGGIVFGAMIDSQNQVHHITAENRQELQLLRGSKYVQSDLGDTFKAVKENLQQGRLCYFTGTGCQVAGLKAYLHKDYATLLTSDLVCHGVPSQWLFDQHVSYLERKHHGVVSEYRFRNNAIGDGCELFNLTPSRGKVREIKRPSYILSPYLYSFMYAMTYRWSCYDCKFAKVPRQGDITLADYWGSKKMFPDMDNSKGVSLCLVNTERGRSIWDEIKDEFEYRESNVQDAARYNVNLIQASKPHAYREVIYEKIRKEGYATVAENEFRIAHYNREALKARINESKILRAFAAPLLKVKRMILK